MEGAGEEEEARERHSRACQPPCLHGAHSISHLQREADAPMPASPACVPSHFLPKAWAGFDFSHPRPHHGHDHRPRPGLCSIISLLLFLSPPLLLPHSTSTTVSRLEVTHPGLWPLPHLPAVPQLVDRSMHRTRHGVTQLDKYCQVDQLVFPQDQGYPEKTARLRLPLPHVERKGI